MDNISFLQTKGSVLICGDFNARTGNENDTISPDKFDEEFHIINNNPPPRRNSQDKTLNGRGKDLIDMCKSLELYIVNGRKLGDPFGKFTCFQWNGNSVVDYLLTSESLFKQLSSFKIGDFLPNLSDHSPLFFTLEIHNYPEVTSTKPLTKDAPKQYIWHSNDTERFLEVLKLPEIDEKLTNILNLDYVNPNNVVDPLTEVLLKTADKAKVKTKSYPKKIYSNDPPWFDMTCMKMKNEIKLMGKKVRKEPLNSNFKSELIKLKRQLKKTVRKNKITYKEEILQKMYLSRKNSRQFWKLLGKLEHKESDEIFKQAIPDEKWIAHFKSVLQTTHQPSDSEELPQNTADRGILDYEISNEELKSASYILRKGKAAGLDSVSNEMIACLLSTKPTIIKKLFNAILSNPTTINNWHISMISPIHKKGSKTDPDNYRGISLLSCLGKFFSAILNQRLMKYVNENNILSKAQLGILPGNRTSDAHLILHNLIDFYCNKRKTYLFGCFVDFHKAFDSIPRNTLFKKLLDHNINGKFYDCLTNMYTGDQSCIKIGNSITNIFVVNQGVKQGCILSPLLFNIFLSDLQAKLETTGNTPAEISPNETLGCLIWADDLLLLSQTETGLNNMLNTLNKFSQDNGLTVNMDKTKVMIFNKTGRHMRRNFYIGNQKVETTREYKYLGFKITPSGGINSGLTDLKDRALKAFFKLRNKMGPLFQYCPPITIKLFETLVKPILLYCSDFWGILKMPKNNPYENIHMKFCKQLLGVQKQTTNIGVLLELGQVPLQLYAIKNAIKNWIRIVRNEKANELVIKSYNLALTEKLKWPSQIEINLSQIGMMEFFITKENDSHIKVFQRLYDIFHQEAFSEISRDSSKLRTYSLIKTEIGLENYLSSNLKINTQDRIALTKFRLSNHILMIEKGRHLKLDRNCRFCPFCSNEIEDEIHFMITCKNYINYRNVLFNHMGNIHSSFLHIDNKEKFKMLLSDNAIIKHTAQYISESLKTREISIGNS